MADNLSLAHIRLVAGSSFPACNRSATGNSPVLGNLLSVCSLVRSCTQPVACIRPVADNLFLVDNLFLACNYFVAGSLVAPVHRPPLFAVEPNRYSRPAGRTQISVLGTKSASLGSSSWSVAGRLFSVCIPSAAGSSFLAYSRSAVGRLFLVDNLFPAYS